MEVEEQQEDAAGIDTGEPSHEEATAMETGEEKGGDGSSGAETREQQEEAELVEEEEDEGTEIDEKEVAVMESLPVEVETDKLRGKREKAPDNAEERVVQGGFGLSGEKTVRASDIEERREVGLDGAGERNGTEHEGEVEGEAAAVDVEAEGQTPADGVEAEGEAGTVGDEVETEVEMVDAAAAIEDGEGEAEARRPAEEKRAGVETNGTKVVQASMKRNASAALDNADGAVGEVVVKKPKKKTNVWSKSTTRKTSRKSKPVKIPSGEKKEECIEVNPAQRFSLEERNGIQLSKDQKAEKVELSLDKMQASSEKGYRMVRATRGITEGAWYFEIIVKDLGKTGHTRLGWSTWKGDLQAPVGFDANSYAFRDIDGSKVHQAIREPYAESPYLEGDVIGFYISLPNGAAYAPKYELYVTKSSRAVYPVPVEKEEGPPKRVPGSEVSFFKNGVCQGVAYTDIFAGEYFPAASMYTFPSPEKKCSVRFNFGPNFQFPVQDWGKRPEPLPMSQAPPPEGLGAVDIEEPPPADGTNETKKSDTPNTAGGKQRMAAERGNGVVEGRAAALGVGSSGGGVRTKRATDDKDRGSKRPGLPGRKLSMSKGSKKTTSMLPRANVAKSPMSDASLQIEVNLDGCSNDGSGDFEVGPSLQDQGDSSDTQTD